MFQRPTEGFESTVWARIDAARSRSPAAVDDLLARYRRPLVRFIERSGVRREDAEDLVQEVLLRLVEKDVLAKADRTRGRFRSLLLGVTKNVLRDERARRSARKRGGGARHVPLAEAAEVAASEPEDEEFDRLFLEHVVAEALTTLRSENPRRHRILCLRFERSFSYQEIADAVEVGLQAVKNELHRARKHLARAIKAEVLRYSSSREEYEADLAAFQAFMGRES